MVKTMYSGQVVGLDVKQVDWSHLSQVDRDGENICLGEVGDKMDRAIHFRYFIGLGG